MEDDYANDELQKIRKKAVAVYFKVFSHILFEELYESPQ
jgi:hypothetical protein